MLHLGIEGKWQPARNEVHPFKKGCPVHMHAHMYTHIYTDSK